MKEPFVSPWICPETGEPLRPSATPGESALVTSDGKHVYPIVRNIPRFVGSEGYAENFGLEWNAHRRTQLDSQTGLPLSTDRFFESTGWRPEEMAGKWVLEVGCGAGRFTEVVLKTGANLVSVDLSLAVEANLDNQGPGIANWFLAQADLFKLPVRRGWFDYVFCFGVLQHTPDPAAAFLAITEYARPGGHIAVDVYPKDWRAYVHWKYPLRTITKHLPTEKLYQVTKWLVPPMMAISTPLGRIPKIGRHLQRLIPVANMDQKAMGLSYERLVEWAILDTFDWFSPAYDAPQTLGALRRWSEKAQLDHAEIFQRGFYVLRGQRKAAPEPAKQAGGAAA